MTEQEIASYKEQMFGSEGQSSNQPPTPPPTNIVPPVTPAADKPIDTPPAITPDTPPITPTIDDKSILKEHLGFEKWEDAKAAVEELSQLREAAKTPKQIEYANEQSKLLHEAIVAGKTDEVYAILDTQRKVAAVETMKPADAIKLHIQQTNKGYKDLDVQDVFEEKYSYPEKPIQKVEELDDEFKEREQKWAVAKEKIDRRIERDAATAKQELTKLSAELKLPSANNPQSNVDEDYNKWKESQANLPKVAAEAEEAYSKMTTKDGVMVFKFNDEANKLAFDIAYEPDKDAFDEAVNLASDVKKFLGSYYDKDGSPDRKRFVKDLYAGRNIDKIVSEAIVAATNETKRWFLANQKNVGDRVQRNFTVAPPSEIDKLKEQVFGKTG